ncbi:hypothetical protein E1B28_001215 [Marasmius oreades]|uniref:ARID domain-containing protein n=1 Tax=Marasmius oreades TaxID=181124 RepID=A0A9P8AF73_9AGAR|nr:uncharacterized protein E1B28_001215 [Marasmius oreades]KAG7099359.1 hypothetical protein E1B28_001215 [Marasmius oreades]
MLPQNGFARNPQQVPSFDNSYNQLDGPMQKQMIALNQASQARMNSNSSYINGGGTNSASSFLGGMQDVGLGHSSFQVTPSNSHPNSLNAPFFDPSMSQSSNSLNRPPNIMERSHAFLNGLASFMAKQNTPLPPTLTGVPVPNYDPSTSMFNEIESSAEPGSFRLAGKDVDMFRLWGTVLQRGGSAMITNNNLWTSLLPLFELPEHYPSIDGSSVVSVAQSLQHFYNLILGAFEDFYRKNTLDKQRMQAQAMRQMNGAGPLPATPTRPGPNPMQMARAAHPGVPTNGSVVFPQNTPGTPQTMKGSEAFVESNSSEDSQALKRKLEPEEHDLKRVRQRTESLDTVLPPGGDRSVAGPFNSTPSQTSTMNPQPRVRLEPSRRKIEYVPLAREVETYGGRDLNQIEAEIVHQTRRQLRELGDWGIIDIDSLTMSIRSRLSTELSYALTTFTLLSTMKGQQPNTGFPLHNAPDLLDEVLDLLEDLAFEGVEDSFDSPSEEPEIITNRRLVNAIIEAESSPFAGLERHKTCTDHNLGLRNKPGTIILAIFNIIRNLCVMSDNGSTIARHPRVLELMLRVCELSFDAELRPASPSLSLSEFLIARKDTLYTLSSIAPFIHLSGDGSLTSKHSQRLTKRIFCLVASYLVDPVEAVTPMGCAQIVSGMTIHRPPALADIALEVLTRISLPDPNRQVFSKAIPQASLWCLFVSLVRRLPVVDADFHIVMMSKDIWLSYLEKLIMALYALAFLSSPKLKTKMKTDRSVGYTGVMIRLIHKLLVQSNTETRQAFYICLRRAVETMKVLDDGEDPFDVSEPTVATLSFGVGYGEVGENELEKGTGLLGGRRDLGWDLILTREVNHDEQMFSELESLLRVQF